MTDFLKIAKSIAVHFAHICAYGVETVKPEYTHGYLVLPVVILQRVPTLSIKIVTNRGLKCTGRSIREMLLAALL